MSAPASPSAAPQAPATTATSTTSTPAHPPLKAVLKASDMADDMQQEMVDLASQALEKYNIEKDIAMHIKKEADRRFGTTWHCVVGKNFGSFVTHETRYFIYFYLGQIAILLWKSS